MAILLFIIHLLSAVFLLLFSVHFLRDGIERIWLPQIRQAFGDQTSVPSAIFKGAGLGFVMQGATAVILLFAGFSASRAVPIGLAAVAALGAELGSALAVQVLFLPIADFGPVAVLIGAAMLLRARVTRMRDIGQVILGIGLIFLSLTLIRASVAPIANITGIEAIFAYLNTDVITAAFAGMVLTLLMTSSIAAILTVLALATAVGLTPLAGLGFVIGCNVGSAILPVWMTRGAPVNGRTVPITVGAVRLSACAICLTLIYALPFHNAGLATETIILAGHVGFNAALMFAAPLCLFLAPRIKNALVHRTPVQSPVATGDIGPAALKRELARMLETIASMTEAFNSHNADTQSLGRLRLRVQTGLARAQDIYAKMSASDRETLNEARQLVTFASRLDRCAVLLNDRRAQVQPDTIEGNQNSIDWLLDAVRRSVTMALETVWTDRVAAATRLVAHKECVSAFETQNRDAHLIDLHDATSGRSKPDDQFLHLIATLKEVNSKLATIGYAVLDQRGGLKKTKLRSQLRAVSP